jgi:hypothetical protein
MGDGNAPAHRAAEEAMHRHPPLSAGKVIGREFHRRFGIGIAFNAAVHPRMQLPDLARHAAFHSRREISRDDFDGCCGTLAEVATELAAPVLERRRLAPANGAGRIDHLDQHIAADRLGQPGPFVLTPRRQCDMMKLDRDNGDIRHAHYRGRWKAGPYRQASPLANLPKRAKCICDRAAMQYRWFADGGVAR